MAGWKGGRVEERPLSVALLSHPSGSLRVRVRVHVRVSGYNRGKNRGKKVGVKRMG